MENYPARSQLFPEEWKFIRHKRRYSGKNGESSDIIVVPPAKTENHPAQLPIFPEERKNSRHKRRFSGKNGKTSGKNADFTGKNGNGASGNAVQPADNKKFRPKTSKNVIFWQKRGWSKRASLME
jgi:hypothetical protein